MKTVAKTCVLALLLSIALLTICPSSVFAADEPNNVVSCTGDGIYLYEHLNYAGNCHKITASTPDLDLFVFNDIASSVRFIGAYGDGRYVATLFEHIEYSGASTKLGADDPDLSNDAVGNDNVSSVRITQVEPSPCTGGGVYLYEHPNYGGRCRNFTADEPELLSVAFNDIASSVRFSGAYGDGQYVATLYEHIEYGGASTKLGADDPDLGNDAIGHDNATSIRIEEVPESPCTGDGIYLFEHLNYAGRCRKFTADDPDLLSVAFNDIASSIRFAGAYGEGRYVVTLFENLDYMGTSSQLYGDDPDLGDDMIGNDDASSIRIMAVPVSPCTGDGIYLYEHPNFGGRCRKFTADDPDLLSAAFNDIASSIRFAGEFGDGRYVATLYEDVEYGGASTKFGADDPDLGNDAVGHDNASSLRIRETTPSPCTGDGIYLYEHLNHEGRCRKFTVSAPDLLSVAFNDIASSIRFAGTYGGGQYEARLYENVEYAGESTQFEADDSDFGDDPIGHDQASSVQIERVYDHAVTLDSDRGNLPKMSDSLFVLGSGPKLDQFVFGGEGPIQFTVDVDRVVGRTDQDGYLREPNELVDAGIIAPKVVLIISAFDVDSNYTGNDVSPESDAVYVNGHLVGHLTGKDGAWSVTRLEVDVSHFKFGIPSCSEFDGSSPPDYLSVCSSAPNPGQNEIRIDVDTANHDPKWGVGIDWLAFSFDAARPILLVHGRGGSEDGSEPCTTPNRGEGCEYWDKDDGLFYFGFRGLLDSAGFLTAHTENYLGGETSIYENAKRLKIVIAKLKARYGVDKINIIAHSKGGLDSRGYISNESLNTDDDVATLITLGSPHHGSFIADIGRNLPDIVLKQVGRVNSDAMKNLSESYMNRTFNPSHPARAGVRYYTVSASAAKTCRFLWVTWTCADNRQESSVPPDKAKGVGISFQILLRSGQYKGINDFAVTVPSARLLNLPGHSGDNSTEFGPYGSNHHSIRAALSLRGSRDLSIINLISDLLDIRPDTVARSAPRLALQAAETEPIDQGSTLAAESGVIAQGQTTSLDVGIDTVSDASILLLWDEGDLHLELVDPQGTVITSAIESDTITYSEDRLGGSLDVLYMEGKSAIYQLIAPETGLWTIRITAADQLPNGQANWLVLMPQESQVTVSIKPVDTWYALNETVQLIAEVTAGDTPLLDATVESSVIQPDGTLQVLMLFDDGAHDDGPANDGVYGNSFVGTQFGIHGLSAKATGVRDGVPYSRSAVNEVQIASGTASIEGTFDDQAVDSDGDGRHDTLQIEVPLLITVGGRYMVTGDLLSSEGVHLATANASSELTPGQQSLPLEFDGAAIWSGGGDGTFKLSNLILLDVATTDLPVRVDAAEAPFTTHKYGPEDFAQSTISLTGESRDYGVDTNTNDKFDDLVVEVEVNLQVAGDYVWNARLIDAVGFEFDQNGGVANFEPGVQTIDLHFDGKSIGDSGRNGPYYVVNLVLWGEGGGINVIEAAATAAYDYRQFETSKPGDGRATRVYLPFVQGQ